MPFFRKRKNSTPAVSDVDTPALPTGPTYLRDLNESQLQAVLETEGYVRVVAGAGSGKTKTLTSRVAYLIDTVGIAPENILCVTFTNKAASEMRNRVKQYLGADASAGAIISTFGSLEARIIREDGAAIGYPKNYQIIDEEDSKRLLSSLLKDTRDEFKGYFEVDDALKVKTLKDALYHQPFPKPYSMLLLMSLDDISKLRDSLRAKLMKSGYDHETIVRYILACYAYEKRKSFACDFEDLPTLCYKVLTTSEVSRSKWQDKLRYIMVDEYQDVSGSEVKIIEILQAKYKNLFAVGDGDQTIYTFRGSDVEHIVKFHEDFAPAKTILLTKNYRSGGKILDASNALVRKNTVRIEKDLTPHRTDPGQVVYYHAKDVYREADFIVDNIKQLRAQNLPYDNIAILYRAHHVTRVIEEKLLQGNIPYKVYSGVGFYQRKEIKDMLAYMRLLTDGDDISFTRVANEPRRQIGPKTMSIIKGHALSENGTLLDAYLKLCGSGDAAFTHEKKQDFAKIVSHYRKHQREIISEQSPLTDLLMYALQTTQYEEQLRREGDTERLENLAEFKQSLVNVETLAEGEPVSIEEYLQNITLLTSQDLDEEKSSVRLMTVHAAKGLEFSVVFVAALNEGIFPSSRIRFKDEMEEERRLAYVAYTRAKDVLVLTDAEGFNHDGSGRYPSRFIFDAEEVNVDYLVKLSSELLASYVNQPSLPERGEVPTLAVNDRVIHAVFGSGVVLGIDSSGVAVQFDDKELPLTIRADALRTAVER